MTDEVKQSYSVIESAYVLNVSAQTILRWIASQKIPADAVTTKKSRGRKGWRFEIQREAITALIPSAPAEAPPEAPSSEIVACAHCVERLNPTRTCVAYLIGAESCSCWEHHGSCTCGAANA